MRPWIIVILLLFMINFSACRKTEKGQNPYEISSLASVPKGFPSVPFPSDNQLTIERWRLGKKLFYDPIMSKSYSVSCASCHLPEYAFSDTVSLSAGEGGLLGTQNAPSLTNVAYHPYLTRAGGVATLEMQILVPIQEHNEFDNDILEIARRLSQNEQYIAMSRAAYDRAPDPYVITRALATFERTLISGNSKYDKYLNGEVSLTKSEENGMNLFFSSRTDCSFCHGGFNFTQYAFENNGLYNRYADSGRMRLTRLETDRARFKVPSLRNIAFTAPYMHDGSLSNLADVIEHYNSGGKSHPNKDTKHIKPLNLTEQEKSELIDFLHTLSDFSFTNNENLKK